MSGREGEAAAWRRRGGSKRETSKRPMTFTLPDAQPRLKSPIPRISKTLTSSQRMSAGKASAGAAGAARAKQSRLTDAVRSSGSFTAPKGSPRGKGKGKAASASTKPSSSAKRGAGTPGAGAATPGIPTPGSAPGSARSIAAATPTSGRSRKPLPTKRTTTKPAAGKANATAAGKKKKTGGSGGGPKTGPTMYKIRAVGETARRVTSLTDIDVALDSLEKTTVHFTEEEVSKTARKAMKDFYYECEAAGLESVEMVEENRVIQTALRKAQSRKRQLRKQLLQMQRVKTELRGKLDAAKAELERREQGRKDEELAHAFLCGVEALRSDRGSKSKGKGKAAAGDNVTQQLTELVDLTSLVALSAPAVAAVAHRLRSQAE